MKDYDMAKIDQAGRENADNVGRKLPETAWILGDHDIYYPNPHYKGPSVRHPDEGALFEKHWWR